MTTFRDSLFLSLDGAGWAIGRAAGKGGDGFPPYNVERFAGTEDRDGFLRITLAVAGFRAEDLDIAETDDLLVIRGRQAEEPARNYLHRGIAARRFQRSFGLGGLRVIGADLSDGLLRIDLARTKHEESARRVPIGEPL